jgi:hypothetical protein
MWLPWEYKNKTTPEHKRQIDHGVALLLRKAATLRFRRYLPGFSGTNNSPTLEVTPLQRQFSSPTRDATPEARFRHLQSLIRALQHPPNFRLTSGSYPQACEWTSTVIATILIDYCHQTADNQYFPDFVAFHRHQPVCHLITQKNDDKLWVVMTYLRGAAYAAGRNEKLRAKFLKRAKFFYYQAKWGWDDSTCGGGMYWGQCSRYKNAVTIELYITVSIRMYEVFGEEWMLAAALRGWVWFQQSGMINAEGLVNDGLDDNGRYLDSFSGSS